MSTNTNHNTMKIIFTTALCLTTFLSSASTEPKTTKKSVKESNKEVVEKSANKNFHSVKNWKMTIEYNNGDILSKIIEVRKGSNLSAMEVAFIEAEKYLKKLKDVKWYNVSPVSKNNFVLLAGD